MQDSPQSQAQQVQPSSEQILRSQQFQIQQLQIQIKHDEFARQLCHQEIMAKTVADPTGIVVMLLIVSTMIYTLVKLNIEASITNNESDNRANVEAAKYGAERAKYEADDEESR